MGIWNPPFMGKEKDWLKAEMHKKLDEFIDLMTEYTK